jgi:zinc transport system substrate-binding protein
MRKWLSAFSIGALALWISVGCREHKPQPSPQRSQIAVSLAPYKYFVERLAGDLFEVVAIVPPGADPHTFEATPRQMESLTAAKVWFSIGEPFERRLSKALATQNRELVVADLRQAWDRPMAQHNHDGQGGSHRCCNCHLQDRHFWMSPKRAGLQAEFIAGTLGQRFPEHKEIFERRLALLKQDLRNLTDELTSKLSALEHRWVLVSHPALGYFCEDFGLHQLSLEVEGKEASPQQLAHLLEQAKHLPVGCIMTQTQHNPAGAQWVANQLGLSTAVIDPYHGDYLANLRHIGELFVRAQKTATIVPSASPETPAAPAEVQGAHGS